MKCNSNLSSREEQDFEAQTGFQTSSLFRCLLDDIQIFAQSICP